MVKKLCCGILFLIVTISVQAQGIEFFHGTWKEAMEKAKSEDKLLFVDAFAKWCGPCKSMAKNVFTQQKVGDYFNANFINLKLDMEEADGVTFGHKYPVSAYPTLFFIDGDGKIVRRVVGGQQADGLISEGVTANKMMDRTSKYEQKYAEGNRDFDLVYNYVKALNASGKPSLKISNDYLNSNPAITEDQKLKFILEAATEADTKLFDQVIASGKKISSIVGKEEYEEKCKAACTKTVDKAIEYEMESLLNESIKKAEKCFPDDAKIFAATSGMKYYRAFHNIDKYTESYRSLAKLSGKDPVLLKPVIIDIVKNFKDNTSMLDDAEKYASRLLDYKNDLESLNTLCTVLVAKNDFPKAIKIVEETMAKVKKNGDEKTDMNGYEALLRFLKSR